MMDDDFEFGALEAGTAFALAGFLMDEQTDRLVQAIEDRQADQAAQADHQPSEPAPPPPKLINAAHGTASADWREFIGQERLKREISIAIASAKSRNAALEHTLLASTSPGVGKTTMARIIASEMNVGLIMLVPPFHLETLIEAARSLEDGDILFIDEIHKLADHGPRAAENLLHILEEKRLYLDEGLVQLNDITVIGATTDAGKLPETIIDRFRYKPEFQDYSVKDMYDIAIIMEAQICCSRQGLPLSPIEISDTIAVASQGVPRAARELVIALRDLQLATGKMPTPEELLSFKNITINGLRRSHREYLFVLYTNFGRAGRDGTNEYVAGEAALRAALRENAAGLARIERTLISQGYLNRTPQGRALTPKGIKYASELARKGTLDV